MRQNMINPYFFAAGAAPSVLTYRGNYEDTANGTTYTSSAISIGTAQADRLVIAALVTRSGGNRTFTSVTIGGVAATSVVATSSTLGSFLYLSLYQAIVPTGTTATVSVTMNNTVQNMGIAVWTITGYISSTAVTSISDNTLSGNDFNLNMNVQTNDKVIGAISLKNNLNRTSTWTGLTEDFDELIETGDVTYSGASVSAASNASPLTITVTQSGTTSDACAVAAVWR